MINMNTVVKGRNTQLQLYSSIELKQRDTVCTVMSTCSRTVQWLYNAEVDDVNAV